MCVCVDENKSRIMVISGESGCGKSTLMARVADRCVSPENISKYRTVVHFVGATHDDSAVRTTLKRLWYESMKSSTDGTQNEDLEYSIEQQHGAGELGTQAGFEKELAVWSNHVENEGFNRLILLVDAINQLDYDDSADNVRWLPNRVPHNVRIIISALDGGPSLAALRDRDVESISLADLTHDDAREIVTAYLKIYGKELDGNVQMPLLIQKNGSRSPLWLTLACEELRIHGEFRSLDDKIGSFSDDVKGLIQQVLERLIR